MKKIRLRCRIERYLTLLCLFVCSATFGSNNIESDQKEPSAGIMSAKAVDHVQVMSDMTVSDTWLTIMNEGRDFCKRLNESVTLSELKKIAVFGGEDLIDINALASTDAPDFSVYFESCNYISPYTSPWTTFGKDTNEELVWLETDAYIDTEHSLLLIDYLDDDKQNARALFVYKKYQFTANREAKKSVWDDLRMVWEVITN